MKQRLVALVSLALFSTAAVPFQARAGVWLQGSLGAQHTVRETGSDSSSLTSSFTSLNAGYAFAQGFVLGGTALWIRPGHANGSSVMAWGPMGGLLLKGFELTAGYLPFASETALGVDRSGGGFVFSIGYGWEVFKWFRLGLRGSYAAISYSKDNGVDLVTKPRVTVISPQVFLAFDF